MEGLCLQRRTVGTARNDWNADSMFGLGSSSRTDGNDSVSLSHGYVRFVNDNCASASGGNEAALRHVSLPEVKPSRTFRPITSSLAGANPAVHHSTGNRFSATLLQMAKRYWYRQRLATYTQAGVVAFPWFRWHRRRLLDAFTIIACDDACTR